MILYYMIKIQYATKLKVGDWIMLCSDGLYNSMALETFLTNMMAKKSLDEILEAYRILCEMRGDDNYTAVLIAVVKKKMPTWMLMSEYHSTEECTRNSAYPK